MSDATTSQGVLVQRGNGEETETFSTISEVLSFSSPDGGANEIDVTSLDSTAKEFNIGLFDGGSMSFDCIFVAGDTAQDGIIADKNAGTESNFKIIIPDTGTTTLSFGAFVTNVSVSGSVDDVVKASVTLRVNGAVTWS